MKLNEKQLEATEHMEGPLLIIAGAGSGKTTVLSHRVKVLVDKGVSPENILCLTFTNKAVKELSGRIKKRVGAVAAENLWVSTFHELARNILNMFYNEQYSVTHTSEPRQMIKKIIEKMPKTEEMNSFLNPSKLVKVIALMKSELITAEFLQEKVLLKEFIDMSRLKEILTEEVETKQNLEALIYVYKAYQSELKAVRKIDVDDMLLLAVKVLVTNPLALPYFHDKYRFMMIDEYQDTNRAQYIMSKLLANKYKNITAVGDDFQSIYKFRGSDIRNILAFDKDYPSAKIIKLEENYRSTKVILQAANELIAHNPEQKQKTLYTSHKEGEKIRLHKANNSLEEARFIASEIKRLVSSKEYAYRDIAVFYRNNAESAYYETVLPNENIPYIITKESSFFERKEIKDILSYLEFALDTTNSFAFKNCINTPKRGIGKVSIDRFVEISDGNDLLCLVKNPVGINLNKNATEGVIQFVRVIESIRSKTNIYSVAELIAFIIQETKYKDSFQDLETHLKKEKVDYLKRLINIAREMQEENPQLTADQFLTELSKQDVEEGLSEAEDFDRVNLLTVHSSKGLEFPVVFTVGMKEKGFPSKFATTTKAIEEERRLCYVAITRAKEILYLTYPMYSLEPSEENPKEKVNVTNVPSRFINEFDSTLIEKF